MTATVFFQDQQEFATLTNVFSVNGVPADPTTVTLTITDPAGATTTPAPTHSGTGTYTANVACTLAGVWTFLWEGTGTASDAIAGTWTVTDPVLGRLYATPAELKSRLGIGDTADDFEVLLACQAASREVDGITGRYFWRATATRTYVPGSSRKQRTDDLVSVTTLKVDQDGDGTYEDTWTPGTDYRLTPYNPSAPGVPWPYTGFKATGTKTLPSAVTGVPEDVIQITGVFGWPSVPPDVKQATLIAAADLFRLKDAPFGVAGFGEFGVVQVRGNPRIMSLLDGYMRLRAIAA